MKYLLIVLACLLTLPAFAQEAVPEIPFESVPNYFKYPAAMNLGEMAAVAVNSKGHVFMLSRSNTTGPVYNSIATQVFEFDQTGNYVREIGHNLYGFGYGHGIRVDKHDNIWVVDKGTDMVMEFNPEGHVIMVLGRKEEAPDEHEWVSPRMPPDKRPRTEDNWFHQPTDVAWDSQENIYVADGYVNSRVAKYNKNGDWIKSWGSYGTAPGQFATVHNVAIDRNNNVYIADRGNVRIEVFDADGNLERIIKIDLPVPPDARMVLGNTPATPPKNGLWAPGAPWSLCITDGPTQYLYTNDAYPGRIYKLTLDGKVIGMLGKAGHQLGQFNWMHGMACPSEDVLYSADLNNWRVQKLILHPKPKQTQTSTR